MRTLALRTADGRWIAHEVRMACSFKARLVGLRRNKSLSSRGGLLLMAARSIDTIGMRFPIDVVFLSPRMRVLGLAPRVPPWRIRLAPRGTGHVLYLAAGQIAATRLTRGLYLLVDTDDERPPDRCVTRCRDALAPLPCRRLPIRFSLRLPRQGCGPDVVRSPREALDATAVIVDASAGPATEHPNVSG
jgi:uncharacterized protein